MFFMLNRLTEGVTEFLNGSALDTPIEMYRYKINVWVGIVLRPINNPDSLFYELKWHILNYILGLTEGMNYEVINYLATNFPVSKLYQHMIFLIKLLFVR